jgi:hypothetical protein
MREAHQNIYNTLITIIIVYMIVIVTYYITKDIHCNIYLIENKL